MSAFLPAPERYAAHLHYVSNAFDKAMDRAGADTAVVYAGGLHYYFLDDSSYPFRSNPHFLYWLPLPELSDSYVVYRTGQKPTLLYYQPADYWHAVPGDPDPYWADHFDVIPIQSVADAKASLPDGIRSPILLGELQNDEQALGIERINPSAGLNSLNISRVTKTEYELEHMREANRLGAIAHRAAAAAFHTKTASEYAIHLAYLESIGFVDNDLPYHSIVGLNENAAVLHYQHREREVPAEVRSFLIDAGARSGGYASDITRTYTTSDGLFADLIKAMVRLQQGLCQRVTAGTHYPDLHEVMHQELAKLLVDSGLGRGSADALLERGITRALLPHGLGHYLGLQVHDVAGHLADEKGTATERPEKDPNLRLTRGLADNEVVTIEPGLYFIDMLLEPIRAGDDSELLDWKMIDALKPFGGIRIEDNVRVNGQTPENLTRDAFAGLVNQ